MNMTATSLFLHHYNLSTPTSYGIPREMDDTDRRIEPESLLSPTQTVWLERGERIGRALHKHIHRK